MMISPWIVICLSVTLAIVEGYYPAYEPKYGYPLVRNRQYNFPTYLPIALTSSSATPVSLPPLKFDIYRNATLLVKNEGRTVTFSPFNPEATATLTGGHVFKDEYVFDHLNYRSNGVPDNIRTTDTQDGVGYPLQFQVFFYNKRYGRSLDDLLKHRDAFVVCAFPTIVEGNVDNPLFTPIQRVLYEIRRPNSTAVIRAEKVFRWLLEALTTGSPYYSYPGAYVDSAGKFYFCTNDVRPSFNKLLWISYSQFKVFTEVLNSFGQPQVSAVGVFPLGPRPFVEAATPVWAKYK